ncbi:transcriptional regulator, LysR family [Emticicia oligotrophica DSM 17448]|uniref:Transcriptional regulator, LysR family n=1 Tax=Emticicia oligotrophica (strain DSM 17448 / CIP 109782 / MTCC 6937 / GPTSA100-15) TaxID=929562 RepID=A0ABN4AMU4_EMTOG|nr:LysR substrate-binding domain-containing protein [Emticicia oligotrophica]AFK03675.1 transcriptional regulator, LysR family [Emticicia oligotrophica DSM 17448]
MNFQQLEYIIAVDKHRHFQKAADECCVTQATLSMMIKKLEEELEVVIFDRSKQPVIPTEAGKEIIGQAKIVLKETAFLKQLAKDTKFEVKGHLRIGIIPTLAPYLLPLFLYKLLKNNPQLKVKVSELNTNQIVEQLEKDLLDVGILATPINIEGLKEYPLFYEKLVVFVSDKETTLRKKFILPEEIDVNRLWLLEEGHCLRSQMMNLCELRKKNTDFGNLEYEAGSIESLLKIVEMNNGITVVPELAVINFDAKQKKQLREFKAPVPVREISLVTYRHFVKTRLLEVLAEEIKTGVSQVLPLKPDKQIVVEM